MFKYSTKQMCLLQITLIEIISKETSGNGNRKTWSGLSSFQIYWGDLTKYILKSLRLQAQACDSVLSCCPVHTAEGKRWRSVGAQWQEQLHRTSNTESTDPFCALCCCNVQGCQHELCATDGQPLSAAFRSLKCGHETS